MNCQKSIVISNKEICSGVFEMVIEDKCIAEKAAAGQFLHLKPVESNEVLLRRPISIHRLDREKALITLLYQLKGKGTVGLSKIAVNEYIDIIGPIGKGFPIESEKRCAIVGGGIGIAPLMQLTADLKAFGKPISCDAYLGFRSDVYKLEEFSMLCDKTHVATEDGSFGEKGYITDIFAGNLHKYDVIYTCGPKIMMSKIKELCSTKKLKCYVSLEEKMGCGVGACLVCVCKTKAGDGDSWHHSKVCCDGPVFDAEEVLLND